MNFNLTKREVTDAVPPKTAIRSGDMFCILRLDGLDPIILWGTGARVSLSAYSYTTPCESRAHTETAERTVVRI